jgi:hypothetical protein
MRIVEAGARRDLGQVDAALVTLQGVGLDRRSVEPWSARLWYAYADLLLALGREDEARDWFAAAAAADQDGSTDADERILELDGVEVVSDDDEEEFAAAGPIDHADSAGEDGSAGDPGLVGRDGLGVEGPAGAGASAGGEDGLGVDGSTGPGASAGAGGSGAGGSGGGGPAAREGDEVGAGDAGPGALAAAAASGGGAGLGDEEQSNGAGSERTESVADPGAAATAEDASAGARPATTGEPQSGEPQSSVPAVAFSDGGDGSTAQAGQSIPFLSGGTAVEGTAGDRTGSDRTGGDHAQDQDQSGSSA